MKMIAITGGPCAGKTSAMGMLRKWLGKAGVRTVFIPEAATDLIQAGIAPWTCASMLEFQTRVMELQIEREQAALGKAAATGAELVVCDRGICDSRAYLSDANYQCALSANGITHDQALARYDAVFHLETVAKSNPQAYTVANNSARFENAEEAAAVDERVIGAWSSHPSFRVIENHVYFHEKASELYQEILQLAARPALRGTPVLVSACLLGEPCRYDGKAKPCQAIVDMACETTLVAVCPEQLGGLPTPRTPSEMQPDGSVRDDCGADRTAAFESGARRALDIARKHGCTRAILKENSPSCGVHHIYNGSFNGTLVPGMGKTAAVLVENGIAVTSENDER